MKEMADKLAQDSFFQSDYLKIALKTVFDLTIANNSDAKTKLMEVMNATSFFKDPEEKLVNTFVNLNRILRNSYQENKKICKLPETNEFEKAMTELVKEALEQR